MAKPKLTNLATVLRLLPTLTDDEKATLRDVLRAEPARRTTTKKASKKPKAPEATLPLINETTSDDRPSDGPLCVACGNTEDYQDHLKPSPAYHAFQSPKGATKKASA